MVKDCVVEVLQIRTKKYVVVLSVLDTEGIKRKHAVGKRARDGIIKHLGVMMKHLPIIPMLVWNRIIAEIQEGNGQQFGALLWI